MDEARCCFVTIVRRQPRVLTQSITRLSTTFTTHVTLGGPDPSHFDPPPPTTLSPPAVNTLVASPEPGPTEDNGGSIYGSNNSLTSAEIGAILGSIIAFVALLLIIWQCLASTKFKRAESDSNSDASSGYMVARRPPRGRPPFNRARPPPPRISSDDSETSTLSSNEWGDEVRTMPRFSTPDIGGWNRPRPARAAPPAHEVRSYPRDPPVAYSRVHRDTRIRPRP